MKSTSKNKFNIYFLVILLGILGSFNIPLYANEQVNPATPWEYKTYVGHLNQNKLYRQLEAFLLSHLESEGGNLEGKVFILDDLADLYSTRLVNFKKAFEINSRAQRAVYEAQSHGLKNIPLSNYLNNERLIGNYIYPLPENRTSSGQPGNNSPQDAETKTGCLGRMDITTEFPISFLEFIRDDDLLKADKRIRKREIKLKDELGLGEGASRLGKIHLGQEDLNLALNSISTNPKYNEYYKSYLTSRLYWEQIPSTPKPNDFLPVVQSAKKALSVSQDLRIQDDYISLSYIYYWLGVSYLETGLRKPGLEQLGNFDKQIALLDSREFEFAEQQKHFIDKVAKTEGERLHKEVENETQWVKIKNQFKKAGVFLTEVLSYAALITVYAVAAYGADQATVNRLAEDVVTVGQGINNFYVEQKDAMEVDFQQKIYLTEQSYNRIPEQVKEIIGSAQPVSPRQLKYARFMKPYELLNFYLKRGEANFQSHNLEEAKVFFEEAISLIEAQRSTMDTEGQRIAFLGNRNKAYYRMVEIFAEKNNVDEAFNYAERGKARAFADVLESKDLHFGELKENQYYWNTLLAKAESSEVLSHGRIGRDQIEDLGRKNRDLKITPSFRSMPMMEFNNLDEAKPIDLYHAEKLLGETASNTAFIEYLVLSDKVMIFLIDSRTILRINQIERSDLLAKIKTFRERLTNPQNLNLEKLKESSQSLYEILIRPVEDQIHQEKLIISPHGPLHYLPFQALYDGQDFLVKKYSISYIPSATVYKYVAEKKPVGPLNLNIWNPGSGDSSSMIQVDEKILLLGNPDLNDSKLDLPYATHEVQKVANYFLNHESLTRNEATESAVKSTASNYDVIHFATHAEFDENDPLNSALLLASDFSNDGRLTLNEIYQMKLNASLIVLSACQTALGQISSGDELIGLYRAFMYSGAYSILGSLWKIDDEATSILIDEFYNQLRTKPLSEALRLAQSRIMEKYPHPYYWGSFIVVGKN